MHAHMQLHTDMVSVAAPNDTIVHVALQILGFNLICRLNLFAKKKLQTNQNISNLIC